MGFAVAKLYIRKYFDESARNQVEYENSQGHADFTFQYSISFQSLEMIANIRSALIDLLDESTWMDDISKRKAIEKVIKKTITTTTTKKRIEINDYLGFSY